MKRFWEKVEVGGPDECWEWQAATMTSSGYGWFRFGGSSEPAHRVAYMLENGEIPDGAHICHSCDNRLCVNPNHLWPGSNYDNQRDAYEKGRDVVAWSSGEENPRAKLTEEKVANIKGRYAAGGVTQRELADEYGVRRSAIGLIVRGERWEHVEPANVVS